MIVRIASLFAFAAIVSNQPLAAQAQSAPNVALSLSATALVRQSDGSFKEASVSNTTLKAGDRVKFTIVALNKGNGPAEHFVPSDPFPARSEYVANSATKNYGTPEFTLDGRIWSPVPLVAFKGENGKIEMKPAPVSSYKAVRWNTQTALAPKASETFAFEVTVK
jgi:uncharacterized repeat protein (TIGR01451 family)